MTTQLIGIGWSLLVEPEFCRRIDDGDVVLTMTGRTIYAAVYNTNNAEAEEAIDRMIEGRPGIPVQAFDREEPAIAGHAYLLPEGRNGRNYWGLHSWTAAKGSVACVTFYFDLLEDLDWAIRVWKSVWPREQVKILN